MLIRQLMEAAPGALESGYGLIGDRHDTDLENVEVFVNEVAFLKAVAQAYTEFMENYSDMDISLLHDDPEIAAQLQNKQQKVSKKKLPPNPFKMKSLNEMVHLPMWDEFCETVEIFSKFSI